MNLYYDPMKRDRIRRCWIKLVAQALEVLFILSVALVGVIGLYTAIMVVRQAWWNGWWP